MRLWILLALSLCCGSTFAAASDARALSRGELLNSTYCSGCHAEQVHWREKKIVKNWSGLVAEVKRWQANAGLNWDNDETEDVARHLNKLYYHYPLPN